MTVEQVHQWFAWVMIGANALAGVWALVANWVVGLRIKAFWWFVAVAEGSIFVQVALGVYLVSVEGIEAPGFHMFYGFVAIISVAILYGYRRQVWPHRFLLYGFGSLFIMGLGLRAIVVNHF